MSTSQSLCAPHPSSSNLKWKKDLAPPHWPEELGRPRIHQSKMAQVARLRICKADAKSCQRLGTHLIIEPEFTELKSGNAIAISYTWGEFNRKNIEVGHGSGKDSDSIIKMQLGKEWDTEDFITTLAQLSATQPIWIDQLCIPKNKEEEVLAKIPEIYNGFDVAAIMPGHPCKCLPTVPDNSGGDEWSVLEFVGPESHHGFCLNALPISSWVERLWTRQELFFSTRIRCVWASKALAKCVPYDETQGHDTIRENLHPFASLELDRLLLKARNDGLVALRWLKKHSALRFDQLRFEIRKYREDELAFEEPGEEQSYQALYIFLSGGYVYRDGPFLAGNETIPAMATRTIYNMLPAEGASVRKATQEPDYVVAMFVGFQGYRPPTNHKKKAVGELLQMALDWFCYCNNGFTFLSSAPRGLFDSNATSSGLWKPVHYLQLLTANSKINSVADVYGTLSFRGLLYVDRDLNAIPLTYQRLLDSPEPLYRVPLSGRCRGLQEFFEDLDMKTPFQAFLVLCSFLESWHKKSMMALDNLKNDLELENVAIDRRTSYVLKCMLGVKNLDETSGDELTGLLTFDDIHDAFYSIVCTALYLDKEVCSRQDLKLVFGLPAFLIEDNKEDNVPRIGLHRDRAEPLGDEVDDSLTIKMGLDTEEEDYLLFEAEKIAEGLNGKPGFRVFGVWVPRNVLYSGEYGAESLMGSGVIDAYLV